jgi:sortase A
MQIIFFGIVVFAALILNALTSQGFFNVSDRLLWQQTVNLLSKEQPSLVTIPSVKIESSVERVGVDKEGNMQTPSSPKIISWYQFGALPGEKGNLVLSGHKDSTFGPGVFYTLEKTKPGDLIVVKTASGKSISYTTNNILQVRTADLPIAKIFSDQKNEKRIYVTTCAGMWNFFTKKYEARILVEGTLQD